MNTYFTVSAIQTEVINALVAINEVALRLARLVLGWVTVCGR